MKWLLKLMRTFFKSVSYWFKTRSYLHLVWSLPGLLVASIVAWIVLFQNPKAHSLLANRYIDAAKQFTADKKYDEAEVLWRKAALLTGNSATVRKGMAATASMKQDYGRAIWLLEKSLKSDNSDDAEVHLLLSEIYIKLRGKEPQNKQLVNNIVEHLDAAHKHLPDHQQTNLFLADYKMKTGDLEGSIVHLRKLSESSSEFSLQHAKIALALKKTDEAMKAARRAEVLLTGVLSKSPENQPVRIAYIQTLEILKEERKLIEAIHEGVKLHPDTLLFRDMLSQVMLNKALTLKNDQPEDLGKKLELIQQSLNTSPRNPLALRLVTELASLEGKEGEQAQKYVQNALQEGYATATMHIILATQLIKKGELESAKVHLEIAQNQNPNSVLILNNLAWLLSHQDPPQLEAALALADKAVSLSLGMHEPRETRAFIYLAMKKWVNAITDAELAIKDSPNKKALHQLLATCYEKLNQPDTAKIHQQAASTQSKD